MIEKDSINLLEPQELDPIEPKPKKKKVLWLFFIIAILSIVGWKAVHGLTLSVWPNDAANYDMKTLQPKNVGVLETVKNFILHSDNILDGQQDDRINILLLGVGGPGHDGAYLSDTNIILSIKPSTHEVALISIPRDLGVNIENHGVRKINAADAFGEAENPGLGGEYARQIFAKNFGLDIPYYVRVDFKAFQEIVDEVGGVTVNVPRTFSDSEFPGENFSYRTISFNAGIQTMNGATALDYARSRHGNNGEGSDFARSRRQQIILSALKEKLLSFGTYTNPVHVQNILSSLSNHITTNLNFGQMMYLANMAKEANKDIKNLVIDNGNNGFLKSYIADSGAFMLGPTTGNFDQINLSMKNVFEAELTKPTPNLSEQNKTIFPTGKVQVLNGTWRAGLAAKYQHDLENVGLSTLSSGNSPRRPIDITSIYIINPKVSQEVIKAVQAAVPGQLKVGAPDWLLASSTTAVYNSASSTANLNFNPEADILLILGTDIKY
ncbi:MAG: LCP family protein [Candidatus Magasanikbacteria bacterium]|nr:LCP family protein [Candidatus Magasanikbacteria bacterium]